MSKKKEEINLNELFDDYLNIPFFQNLQGYF